MRLIRSWPASIPEGRNYVVDQCERLILDDHDYAPLGDIDDDVLLLEWDIAVDRDELVRFADLAARDRDRVIVAPYRLYASPGGSLERKYAVHLNQDGGFWVHMNYADGVLLEPVSTGDPTCHMFGFGMVYLPRELIRGYLEHAARFDKLRKLSDTSFSLWHHHKVSRDVPICWDIHPVHLHCQIGDLG